MASDAVVEETITSHLAFQSALRFAVVSDPYSCGRLGHRGPVSIRFKVRGGFRPIGYTSAIMTSYEFQSALRFAVVSDPTPWHAVLTSPVVVVLHTTPPHPLQPGDRTCPKWGKTPSQVPYTPEAVFGRSPTPLSEGVSTIPSRRKLGVFITSWLNRFRKGFLLV